VAHARVRQGVRTGIAVGESRLQARQVVLAIVHQPQNRQPPGLGERLEPIFQTLRRRPEDGVLETHDQSLVARSELFGARFQVALLGDVQRPPGGQLVARARCLRIAR